jgi:hypothetical protein
MDEVPEKTLKTAQEVADALAKRGHAEHAERLRAALKRPGSLLRSALRDACQVVLTAIEAIDPVSATMVEELRLELDAWAASGRRTGRA